MTAAPQWHQQGVLDSRTSRDRRRPRRSSVLLQSILVSGIVALGIPALAALLALAGCGTVDQPSPGISILVPEGQGHWVRIDEEIDVRELAGRHLVMAYGPPLASGGARSDVPGAAPAVGKGGDLIAYRVDAVAHPLEDGSRCPIEIVGLILVHRDGHTDERPAQGHVIDNSDGRRGFRTDVSPVDQRTAVIPAHATATAVFTATVVAAPE